MQCLSSQATTSNKILNLLNVNNQIYVNGPNFRSVSFALFTVRILTFEISEHIAESYLLIFVNSLNLIFCRYQFVGKTVALAFCQILKRTYG